MKVAAAVSPEKLRGGFYTPDALVERCLDRIEELTNGRDRLRVLEPSIGDGAFLRGLSELRWEGRVESLLGLELIEGEAEQARAELARSGIGGEVLTRSTLDWSASATDEFDVAIGNPPFVRFQFVSPADRRSTELLSERLGYEFGGVSNLWIPVLLGSLSRLAHGGVFSFVIPTECFTGMAASVVREWFVGETADLRFDLFQPGSFPGVLQEVTVVSGRRVPSREKRGVPVAFVEHDGVGATVEWSHQVDGSGSWTRYLLGPAALDAMHAAEKLAHVRPLREIANFDVSLVTGANDFFSATTETVDRFELDEWAKPLLPRSRFAEGLEFTLEDHAAMEMVGARRWILDFGSERPEPSEYPRPLEYIEQGEALELHERYKCRIREPWYRVPNFRRGDLLLSKRSHHFPRVILNSAEAFTTDTIYCGWIVDPEYSATAFTAGFHNSLTLLSAELFGRSFGGGVLELVPSEVAELRIPKALTFGAHLRGLDALSRSGDSDSLIEETDRLMVEEGILPPDLCLALSEAREALALRRTDRGKSSSRELVPA